MWQVRCKQRQTESLCHRYRLSTLVSFFPKYGMMLRQYLVSRSASIQKLMPNLSGLFSTYCVNLHFAFVGNNCSSTVSDSAGAKLFWLFSANRFKTKDIMQNLSSLIRSLRVERKSNLMYFLISQKHCFAKSIASVLFRPELTVLVHTLWCSFRNPNNVTMDNFFTNRMLLRDVVGILSTSQVQEANESIQFWVSNFPVRLKSKSVYTSWYDATCCHRREVAVRQVALTLLGSNLSDRPLPWKRRLYVVRRSLTFILIAAIAITAIICCNNHIIFVVRIRAIRFTATDGFWQVLQCNQCLCCCHPALWTTHTTNRRRVFSVHLALVAFARFVVDAL